MGAADSESGRRERLNALKSDIQGIIVATLTPLPAAGGLGAAEEAMIERHTEFLIQGGVHALAPCGTTGESLYLSEVERSALVRATVRAAAGRVPVIAGIWSATVDGAQDLARAAERSGASAVFLTPPIYYPASDEAVARWYRAIHEVTELPLFAYHIPQYAVNGISPTVLRRLKDEEIIRGIKDSTGNLTRVAELLEIAGDRISVYGASDSSCLAARKLGVDGFISALANIYPAAFRRIWAGDEPAQRAIDGVRTLVKGYGGIGGLKALLRVRGFDFGPTRLPFGDLSAAEEAALRSAVELLTGLD